MREVGCSSSYTWTRYGSLFALIYYKGHLDSRDIELHGRDHGIWVQLQMPHLINDLNNIYLYKILESCNLSVT